MVARYGFSVPCVLVFRCKVIDLHLLGGMLAINTRSYSYLFLICILAVVQLNDSVSHICTHEEP